ncbi:MAG: terminase TerL endonuclease subunit, partial [bacterium]
TFKRIGYDPWNANETTVALGQDGFSLVPVRQGYSSLSAPTKRLERVVLEHELRHGGDPVLTWMASCLEVKRDEAGNVKPIRPDIDRASTRIDGMSALAMAMFCWLKWGARRRRRLPAGSVG